MTQGGKFPVIGAASAIALELVFNPKSGDIPLNSSLGSGDVRMNFFAKYGKETNAVYVNTIFYTFSGFALINGVVIIGGHSLFNQLVSRNLIPIHD